MDEKTIQRIKKLQALAERGVGGEKTTAQKKLAKLLKDNGINSLDELQKEEYEYTIFSYNGKHEIKLLRQCMYKVIVDAVKELGQAAVHIAVNLSRRLRAAPLSHWKRHYSISLTISWIQQNSLSVWQRM